MSNSNGQRLNTLNLLEKLILEDNQFAVQDILPNTFGDASSLNLVTEYACPQGQVVVEPDCVPCAVGTFYNVSSKTCLPCPEGSYRI